MWYLRHCYHPVADKGGGHGMVGRGGWRFRFGPSRGDASAAPEAPVRAQHHSWWFRARIPRQGATTFRGKGKRFRPGDSATLPTPFSRDTPKHAAKQSTDCVIKKTSKIREEKKRRGKEIATHCFRRAMITRRKKDPANVSGHREVERSSNMWRRWKNQRQKDTNPRGGI